MPKERLHMLLASETYNTLGGSRGPLDTRLWHAYLLGSIMPDIFFYDIPTFSLASFGNALHRFQGTAGLDFFRASLEEAKGGDWEHIGAWIQGFANHFLADGFYHPIIDGLSLSACGPCRDLGLSSKSCHHWLESEMEAYWLARLGPHNGYLPVLRQFMTGRAETARYAGYYRQMLIQAGFPGVPSIRRIRTCLFWQTFALTQFANPKWAKLASLLLRSHIGQPLGVLLVPARPHLCLQWPVRTCQDRVERRRQEELLQKLCDVTFMARAVIFLATHLRELPGPF